jgi:cation transport ATPase
VVAALERDGETTVLRLLDSRPAAVLGLTDRLRPEAAPTVRAPTALTSTAPLLLTGDNATVATRIARDVGIRDIHADLLPSRRSTTSTSKLQTGTRSC